MVGESRLPRNAKEGLLYRAIIAAITASIMTTLNVSTTFGRMDAEVASLVLRMVPVMIIIAMLLEGLVVGRLSSGLVERFSDSTDGFNARILFNILFTVTGMSLIFTIMGIVVFGGISGESLMKFFRVWPRNFFVALWCEILLAQPLARLAMKRLHARQTRNMKVGGDTHA